MGDVGISTVTLAELRYGADKSRKLWEGSRRFEKRGIPIGPLDTLIAAHALRLGVALVTNNTAEFSRVNGLTIEDWSVP